MKKGRRIFLLEFMIAFSFIVICLPVFVYQPNIFLKKQIELLKDIERYRVLEYKFAEIKKAVLAKTNESDKKNQQVVFDIFIDEIGKFRYKFEYKIDKKSIKNEKNEVLGCKFSYIYIAPKFSKKSKNFKEFSNPEIPKYIFFIKNSKK